MSSTCSGCPGLSPGNQARCAPAGGGLGAPVIAAAPPRAPSLGGAAGRPGLSAALCPQDLGVTKVGHMKRILCGIKELSRGAPAAAAAEA